MKTFLNATAHTLTIEQIEDLKKMGYPKPLNLKDVSPDLFADLLNSPIDIESLKSLANKLGNVCAPYSQILLPIGSPAFMFCFTELWANVLGNKVTFSHSIRESIEKPDGTKLSAFKHVKFISF